MEHRWGHRHNLDRMVLLRAPGWRVLGRIRNLSVSGAFLRCPLPHSGVTRLFVDLRMGPGERELTAEIVRFAADGIGVEWSTLAPAQVVRLLTSPPPRRVPLPEQDPASRLAAAAPSRSATAERHAEA